MRRIAALSLAVMVGAACACAQRMTHYSGYIIDPVTGRGAAGLEIRLELSGRVDGYTDSSGYFKVSKRPTGLENIYVARHGVVLDTLYTIVEFAGEQREFRFVSGRADTFVLSHRPVR